MSAAGQRWKTAVRLAVCLLLLAWIFNSIFTTEGKQAAGAGWKELSGMERWRLAWRVGPRELWHTLRLVKPVHFALSLIFMGATILLGVFRWKLVLERQGLPLPMGRAVHISFVAHFFNAFLLGSTGGDVIKAVYAARETHHKKAEAVVTVLMDRMVGLWSMLAFAGTMMFFEHGLLRSSVIALPGAVALAMLAGCTLALVLALWGHGPAARAISQRLGHFPKWAAVERSLSACRHFQEPGFLLKTVGVSMALNTFCVLQFWILGRGLGLGLPTPVFFAVVPMIISISAIPITPNGLGMRENLFVAILSAPVIGANPAAALALSLLAYAGSLFWSVMGGLVYLGVRGSPRLSGVS